MTGFATVTEYDDERNLIGIYQGQMVKGSFSGYARSVTNEGVDIGFWKKLKVIKGDKLFIERSVPTGNHVVFKQHVKVEDLKTERKRRPVSQVPSN